MVSIGLKDYSLFRYLFPSGYVIDDQFDQINRSLMVVTMALFGLVTTIRQHTGTIISCNGFQKFSSNFAEDYCWTQGLYTVLEAYDLPEENVIFPGLVPVDLPPCIPVRLRDGSILDCPPPEEMMEPTRIHHLWYQWIPFYFWISAEAFYLPYLFYKNMGVSQVKPLLKLLHNPVETDEEAQKTLKKSSNWLFARFKSYVHHASGVLTLLRRHDLAISRMVTKLLYLGVALMCFYLTGEMFDGGGNFYWYGVDWADAKYRRLFDHNATVDATRHWDHVKDKLFPKMVACEIRRWGSSGMEMEHGTCVLAPNVINQYLFLITWYMLAFVIVADLISIIVCLFRTFITSSSYHLFLTVSMMKDTPHLRLVYYSIGSSGRVILHLLASQVRQKVLEDMVKAMMDKMRREKLLDFHQDYEKVEEGAVEQLPQAYRKAE